MDAMVLTRDGLKLTRRHWRVARPCGTVVLVHGIAEHSGRYAHVAALLNEWGWSVESYDQRGHGLSHGARACLRRDDDLVQDLAAVLATVRQEQPDRPLLLMGHSLGGLVAARYAADLLGPRVHAGLTPVDGLILSSPALAVRLRAVHRLLLATLARFAPDVAVRTGFDPRDLCRDPAVVYRYASDPLVHDRLSGRLARFIIEGGGYVRALAEQWTMPTLLLYAGADRIVDPGGAAAFATAASRAVQAQCFAHMAHEILNEPDQALVCHALRRWLAERFGEPLRQAPRVRRDAA